MTRWPTILIALLLLGAETLDAQCRARRGHRSECRERHERPAEAVQFGLRGGYDFEDGSGVAGAQLRIPLVPQVMLAPSGVVFFEDDAPEWQLNADLVLRPRTLAGVYAGFGAALVHRDFEPVGFEAGEDDTRVGYNLFVGLEGGRIGGSTARPFAEARWTGADDYDAFRLLAGFNVPVSGGRF